MDSQKPEVSRRDFLKTGAITGAASLAAMSGITFITNPKRVFGANDRVRVAVCGVRSRGFAHIRAYSRLPNAEIAALCDVDDTVLDRRLADVEKLGKPRPKRFIDCRKVMEDKSIDAVSIATPDHWHALIGILACQAGKDVYVEKPCSHYWWDGYQLVRAAEKYNRIVQMGAQSRSHSAIQEAIQKMRDGLIGEVYLARGLCYKWRPTIGHTPVSDVPTGVHYDLWLGPAPEHSFTRNRFHYNWHWFWDYGSGDLGNQGIHEVDIARWGLGLDWPTKISAIGGKFMFDDDQKTPNVLNCAYEFETPEGSRRMMEFEVRGWITNHEAGIGTGAFRSKGVPPAGLQSHRRPHAAGHSAAGAELGPAPNSPSTIGNIFYGSKGYLAIEGYDSYRSWLGEAQEPGPGANGGGNHFANFIDACISRRKQDLTAPIEEGHKSTMLVNLANVSYRLGRTLQFDGKTQRVVGDDEANRMLYGTYRAPFTIPENV
ncbi:MAG: Gfo/Idh/MocA family oxidoreductase [Acidobacteriota bacterium]|nr:Gfo/Idh/MocA family oxidoreductase [Acidobacteriota bacterium]